MTEAFPDKGSVMRTFDIILVVDLKKKLLNNVDVGDLTRQDAQV